MGEAVGPVLSAAGSIAGGIAAKEASAGDIGRSRDAANISSQILQEIHNAPDISKRLILEKYKQAGVLTPAMEQNIIAQIPQAIGQDSQAVDAQRQALQEMRQRAAGGLSAGDRAALNQAQQKAQGDVSSRLASIQQQQQAQGLSDSGSKLAMQMAAAQGGANNESESADRIAQQAQQAAIQATGQAAGLGGQLEGQNFGEGMANQQAQQQMQRFNIQNQLGVQQQNVGAQNQAQAANLANAQQVSNMNVGGQNAELNNQLGRQMQEYGANRQTAQIKAGGMGQLGQSLNQMGQDEGNAAYKAYAGAGKAAGGAASSLMMSQGGAIHDYTAGGHVDGQEMVPGDHPMNDTVDAKLSPGEIVIPKTVAKSALGKKLLKLLEDHHHVQRELDKYGNNE